VLKFGIAEKDFDVPAFHIPALIEGFPESGQKPVTRQAQQ